MRTSRWSFLIALLTACVGTADQPAVARAPATDSARQPLRRAVVQSAVVHVETLAVASFGRPPAGPAYDSAVRSFLLPATREPSATFAPNDTDVSNYAAGSGWMRGNDTSGRGRNRFSLGYERYTSGILILRLDTLLQRELRQSPFETAGGDSIAIAGLARREGVADECRLLGFDIDEHIVGLLPSDTVDAWMRPRLAWFVDTAATRFRRMRPDSVVCWLPPGRDR